MAENLSKEKQEKDASTRCRSGVAGRKDDKKMGVMSELDFAAQTNLDASKANKLEYQLAIHLHRNIMANAQTAADALIEFCKGLKEMRDSKLYMELGYENFEDYTVQAVGLKQRQAYGYISTYEKLGKSFLQSNAKLGITKLELLAAVPAIDREDVAEEHDLDGMSVTEVRELVAKYNQTTEQLSLLQQEQTKLTENAEDEKELARKAQNEKVEAQQEKDELLQEVRELKAKISNLPADDAEKIRAEEAEKAAKDAADQIKEAQKEAAAKIKAAKEIAKADAQKEITAAEEKAKQAQADTEKQAAELAKKQLAESLKDIEREKADAIARATELEQKLKVAANKDTVTLNFHLTEMQKQFSSVYETLTSIAGADPHAGEKFRGAVNKVLDVMKERLEGES